MKMAPAVLIHDGTFTHQQLDNLRAAGKNRRLEWGCATHRENVGTKCVLRVRIGAAFDEPSDFSLIAEGGSFRECQRATLPEGRRMPEGGHAEHRAAKTDGGQRRDGGTERRQSRQANHVNRGTSSRCRTPGPPIAAQTMG